MLFNLKLLGTILIFCAGLALGQSANVLTTGQLRGFQHVFMSVSDVGSSPVTGNQRLERFALQLGLASAERDALGSVASQFRQALAHLNVPANNIDASAQRQALDQETTTLAVSFLQQLPASKKLRVLASFEDPSKIQ